jgi:hypothetical protein
MDNTLKLFIEADKKARVDIPNPTEKQKDDALHGVFSLFGVSLPGTPIPPAYKEVQQAAQEVAAATLKEPPVVHVPQPKPKLEPVERHHHVKAVVEGEPQTMEEAPLPPKRKPPLVSDSVRIKNGKPAYRCFYRCTKCEHTGRHYIYEGTQTVDCHECQTSLQVKKATPGTAFTADPKGNYYVAGAQIPSYLLSKKWLAQNKPQS